MSDGINDAEGRDTKYDKFRAKHKGKWGVWDCGYFYEDKVTTTTTKKKKTRKVVKKTTRALQLKEAAVNFVSGIGMTEQHYEKITDQDFYDLIKLLNRVYKLGVQDGRRK